jgi:hypothetical protein
VVQRNGRGGKVIGKRGGGERGKLSEERENKNRE